MGAARKKLRMLFFGGAINFIYLYCQNAFNILLTFQRTTRFGPPRRGRGRRGGASLLGRLLSLQCSEQPSGLRRRRLRHALALALALAATAATTAAAAAATSAAACASYGGAGIRMSRCARRAPTAVAIAVTTITRLLLEAPAGRRW